MERTGPHYEARRLGALISCVKSERDACDATLCPVDVIVVLRSY